MAGNCHDWANKCLVDSNDSGASCKEALGRICADAQDNAGCLDTVCGVITNEDVPGASSWCNKCTGQSCYGWRQLCEIDPTAKPCADALDLICTHGNSKCRNDVCSYHGTDEEVNGVLSRWCASAGKQCRFPSPQPSGTTAAVEQVASQNVGVTAFTVLVATGLGSLALAKRNSLKAKAQSKQLDATSANRDYWQNEATKYQQQAEMQAGILENVPESQRTAATDEHSDQQRRQAVVQVGREYDTLWNPRSPQYDRVSAQVIIDNALQQGLVTPQEIAIMSQTSRAKFGADQSARGVAAAAAGPSARPLLTPLLSGNTEGAGGGITDPVGNLDLETNNDEPGEEVYEIE